jgi:hypothetical protein
MLTELWESPMEPMVLPRALSIQKQIVQKKIFLPV